LPGAGLLRWQNSILQRHYAHDREKMYFSSILASILIGFALLLLVIPIGLKVLAPELFEARTRALFLPIEFALMFACFGAYGLLMRGYYNAGRVIFTAASFIVTLASLFLTGGFPGSIVTPCLILLPVIVHLLYGHRIGWMSAAAILVIVGLQWAVVYNFNIILPDYTSTTSPNTNLAIVFLVAFGAIQSGIAFYQRQNQKLNEELNEERRNLERQANHDSLTGLKNPRFFYSQLENQRQIALQNGSRHAVIYMDLDDFKLTNDGHGHMVGDRVLKVVAARLTNCVGDGDTVARMGGDEFAILVTSCVGDAALKELRNRLQQSIGVPVEVGGQICNVGTSVGYALYPEDADTSQKLLQLADQDMYRDKSLKGTHLNTTGRLEGQSGKSDKVDAA